MIAGFFGGFVLSAIKRDLKAKDWGYIIEGHGGVLDRIDSLTFAAPLFFHVTRYWFRRLTSFDKGDPPTVVEVGNRVRTVPRMGERRA